MHYDFLIIGQGLAGSLLAWQLIGAGRRVLVIDNDNIAAASRVAAGLINPVTGKRLVKEPKVERYLPVAWDCYSRLSEQFSLDFIHTKPLLRLFDNIDTRLAWEKRFTDTDYQAFIGQALNPGECGYPQGGFIQHQTAYLLTSLLLTRLRQWLEQQSALCTAEFDYSELQTDKAIRWRDKSTDHVVFCEGARVVHNPWFKSLPMQLSRGDILTLHTEDELPPWIINSGQWLLPLDNGMFKLGATYDWPLPGKPLDENISPAGKVKLIEALSKLCPGIKHYDIVGHQAGVRPNSKDKRPFIGFHPGLPQLAVFNGFGSKGSMLIPYYAGHFAGVLLNNMKLDPDVDIKRLVW